MSPLLHEGTLASGGTAGGRRGRGQASEQGRGAPGRRRGLGGSRVTVKGVKADAEQRQVIDQALEEAQRLGASRRVMVASVMCMTQESVCRRLGHGDAAGPDSRGPYQQRAAWGPFDVRMDPAGSTELFLTGGRGGQPGWRQKHGGLKHAPGDLDAAITVVQVSVGGYGDWQQEAERTVATWLGRDGFGTSGGGVRSERFEFTRGERDGERENSWQAAERLVRDVRGQRWAAGNVFHAVSEDELRAAAPSLTIHGDEAWLLSRPAYQWGSGREVSEVTLRVLTDRWDIMPGAVVIFDTGGPVDGRYIVKSIGGQRLDSPEAEVVFKRPTRLRAEPPPEVAETSSDAGTSSDLLTACRRISRAGGPYVYGGGHGVALSSIKDGDGLDCSSSCSVALKRANMFPGNVALVSGQFAASWGKPGKGDEFTVWANSTHVWIEFHDDDSDVKRFDTSPYGSGGSGPRVRTTARNDQARFTPRHWRGR